jgi:hypothetical protein
MCWDDLSLMWTTSDSVIAMSVIVRAWMVSTFPSMLMDHGTRSTVTYSNGTDVSSHGGNLPCPWPVFLYHWQVLQVCTYVLIRGHMCRNQKIDRL